MALKRWIWLALFLIGCDSGGQLLPIDLTRLPGALPVVTQTPTLTPVPRDTGWRTVQPGLEYREVRINAGERSDRLRLARIDPNLLTLRVLYQPDRPLRVSEWLAQAGALLAVNGNYFDPENRALGLILADGVRAGVVYDGFGGMLAVTDQAVRVRANVSEPYSEGEPLRYAMQNFPMLVLPGGQANPGIDDNGRYAPRTAVAQDRAGRILFIVSPSLMFTLTSFGQWLAASDLDVDVALNLDGGTSSGLLLRNGADTLGLDSWVGVPSAIVAVPR